VASRGQLLKRLTDALNDVDLDISKRPAAAENNVVNNARELYKGYDARTRVATDGLNPREVDVYFDPKESAANGINPETGNYKINISPDTDEAFFAHELGHITSRQTPAGGTVRDIRNAIADNPNLRNALMGAAVLVPGAASALEEGNNDLDTSLAIAAALQLPTLIDEGMATRQGLKIMDNAGRRARLGQYGKLAGGYLSYLAPAALAGLGGNAIGNLFD
jgi:hypothetical protein